MNTKFFNPEECPFEVIGFREDLSDRRTHKMLGTRNLAEPTRPVGSPGLAQFDLTEPTALMKNGLVVTIKASPKNPVPVESIIIVLCGRVKEKKS
jgi:hypothetical protein